jgi:hypothetical protein
VYIQCGACAPIPGPLRAPCHSCAASAPVSAELVRSLELESTDELAPLPQLLDHDTAIMRVAAQVDPGPQPVLLLWCQFVLLQR